MSGLMLNIDVSYNGESSFAGMRKESVGNSKHQRFMKKRRFLERKGFLHDKQIQHRQGQGPKQTFNRGPQPWKNGTKHDFKPNLSPPDCSTPKSVPSQSLPKLPLSKTNSASVSTQFKTCSNSIQSKSCQDSTPTSSQTTTISSTSQSLVAGPTRPLVLGGKPPFGNPLKYLAMDCEMVGTGPKGHQSELARCSIVSYDGDVVYDKYIMPTRPVTDFRTRWSGIRQQHLCNATPFMQAKREILRILAGKVVVGHAIHNDFKALCYSHPACLTRDTSRIPLLNKKAGFPEKEAASLKRLTKAIFNRDIQVGKKGHSSVEDAKATMELYKVVEVEWERTLASKSGH
ncbi:hypothetical protein MATL_G00130170 [Megalops atlanticus]|uniref:Exonuclease domain-containing protein n=1 Tax=Megalops atlanticus TaxID=7932 RepID=A0A9D3PXL3_MEGAT|nr:hypothetical protein MATL_G00130170 [Megalops atlanticus]